MGQDEPTLTVVTATELKMRSAGDPLHKLADKGIALDTLRENFQRFLSNLEQIFLEVGQGRVGDFVLEEVTFSAEIGTNGEFKLVGTGVGISASSGVTFTLRRQSAHQTATGP